MEQQQTPNWEAALMAAGMAAVYNADDWESIVDNQGTTLHPAAPLIPFFAH